MDDNRKKALAAALGQIEKRLGELDKYKKEK